MKEPTDDMLQKELDSPSYEKSFFDDAFMSRDELRGVRLQLELLKPDQVALPHSFIITYVQYLFVFHKHLLVHFNHTQHVYQWNRLPTYSNVGAA